MIFQEKHRWQVKNHMLTGCTLGCLLTIFKEHRKDIEWIKYGHRILFLICISSFNSVMSILEMCIYGAAIESQELHPEPVFILGHPRTGTTHLHNLLALDPRFTYANTFQTGFPSSFLLLQRFRGLLAGLLDKTRPMDNMRLSWELPQEDEIATNVLSAGVSPYMQIVFMKHFDRYKPYFEFGDDCPKEDKQRWKEAFLFFMKKVTFHRGQTQPMLIKSPVHTARIKLIQTIFPRAKFIFIHRNPYEVLQSAIHMANTYYWYCYLSTPNPKDIEDFIFLQYQLLYKKYFEDRHLIEENHVIEISFECLEAHPKDTLRKVYDQFGWSNFDTMMKPRISEYLSQLTAFKKNAHQTLAPSDVKRAKALWKDSFEALGYVY